MKDASKRELLSLQRAGGRCEPVQASLLNYRLELEKRNKLRVAAE